MVSQVAAELGKIAVAKLAEVKPEDALRALRGSSIGAAVLVPGPGAFVLGVAVGAGLGRGGDVWVHGRAAEGAAAVL